VFRAIFWRAGDMEWPLLRLPTVPRYVGSCGGPAIVGGFSFIAI
jgi:hypothetical protein